MTRCAPSLALAAALLIFLAEGVILARAGPGLHYDEALFQVGAVHMLASPGPPTFTHPPYGWVRVHGRFWPVMVMPYAGAPSAYLLLPVFAMFGPVPWIARLAAATFVAAGLWGLGRLVGRAAGPWAAAASLSLLCIHPGMVSNSVFNDSGFAYWMLALGAVAVSLRGYLDRRTVAWAIVTGVACGFGLWVRLNVLWLLAGATLGALAGFGRRAVPPWRHLAAALAGGALGALPLIGWLLVTRFRPTLDYMASSDAGPRRLGVALERLHALGEALLYDAEHRRGMWDGPALPWWHVAFVSCVVTAALVAGFLGGEAGDLRRWHRAVATAVLGQAAAMLASRLVVREHHFLTLVPLAAVAVVLGVRRFLSVRPGLRLVVTAAAVLYVGIALHWDWALRRGLLATGGTGIWSNASGAVARALDERRACAVAVLDWGFDTPLQVVSAGRLRPRELFWHFAPGGAGWPEPVWRQELRPGALFLTHAPTELTPMGAAATARFEELLGAEREVTRTPFTDGRGRPHTVLIEIAP